MLISHQKLTIRIRDLIRGSLTVKMVHDSAYLARFIFEDEVLRPYLFTWTSSGRAALKHILLNEKSVRNVALPAFTCHVVKDAIERAGKKVVYFDAAEVPTVEEVRSAIEDKKSNIDALVLPYNFGFMADSEKIAKICRKNDVLLIEDCAQALGAEYNRKKAGSFGNYAAYSFGISKNIGFIGGAIVGKNKIIMDPKKFPLLEKASRMLEALLGGMFFNKHLYPMTFEILKKKPHNDSSDLDYRLSDYCRAVVFEIAKRYDQILALRRENAELCMEELDGVIDFIKPIKNSSPAWLYFVLMIKDKEARDSLRKALFREKIDVQPLLTFGNLTQNKKFAKAERIQDSHLIFALYRSRNEIEYIIRKIKKVCK